MSDFKAISQVDGVFSIIKENFSDTILNYDSCCTLFKIASKDGKVSIRALDDTVLSYIDGLSDEDIVQIPEDDILVDLCSISISELMDFEQCIYLSKNGLSYFRNILPSYCLTSFEDYSVVNSCNYSKPCFNDCPYVLAVPTSDKHKFLSVKEDAVIYLRDIDWSIIDMTDKFYYAIMDLLVLVNPYVEESQNVEVNKSVVFFDKKTLPTVVEVANYSFLHWDFEEKVSSHLGTIVQGTEGLILIAEGYSLKTCGLRHYKVDLDTLTKEDEDYLLDILDKDTALSIWSVLELPEGRSYIPYSIEYTSSPSNLGRTLDGEFYASFGVDSALMSSKLKHFYKLYYGKVFVYLRGSNFIYSMPESLSRFVINHIKLLPELV